MNNHVMEASGYNEQDILGKDVYPFFYPGAHESERVDQFYNDINTLGTGKMEVTFIGKDNNPLTFQVVGMRCPLGGMDDTYLLIGQDVTFLNKTLHELNESEERYRKLLEASVEGVFIFDSPDSISFVNQAACELLGYTSMELMNLSPKSFLADMNSVDWFYKACEVINGGEGHGGDVVIVSQSGQRIEAAMYGTSIVLKGKPVLYFSIRDITARKQHEVAIRQSEQKFRSLTENISDQIIRLGLNGELLYINKAFCREYDVPNEYEATTLWDLEIFPDDFSILLKESIAKASGHKLTRIVESTTKIKERDVTIEWTISPEFDGEDGVLSLLCVGRDVTLQQKARKELLEAKDKAESADKLKSAFLANLSHEIRTPLNAIVGFSSLLKDLNIEEREKLEYIEIINRSSDNLMSLINDIIDIAKIVSGELKISRTVFRVNDLLREMQIAVQRKLRSDGGVAPEDILLDVPKLNYEPVIETDPARLNQVIMNLLGNAVKFSTQGSITFGYRLHNGLFRFFVKDTGIGISAEKLRVIFDPFRQGEESISKRYGGTGLGLSISKRLVDLLGGNLMVESESGQGSEFYFDLPDVANPAARVNMVPKHENRYTERHQVNYHWPDRLVLLVDDNSYVHLQLRKYFENTGLTLISARTGASARELLRNRKDIDLVLLDVQMFETNEFDFVKQLKAIRSDIPMIAQTALTMSGDRERALVAGFDEYVPKPVSRELLLETLNQFLSVNKGIHSR
jgi:PAS domain S-box-containing protein